MNIYTDIILYILDFLDIISCIKFGETSKHFNLIVKSKLSYFYDFFKIYMNSDKKNMKIDLIIFLKSEFINKIKLFKYLLNKSTLHISTIIEECCTVNKIDYVFETIHINMKYKQFKISDLIKSGYIFMYACKEENIDVMDFFYNFPDFCMKNNIEIDLIQNTMLTNMMLFDIACICRKEKSARYLFNLKYDITQKYKLQHTIVVHQIRITPQYAFVNACSYGFVKFAKELCNISEVKKINNAKIIFYMNDDKKRKICKIIKCIFGNNATIYDDYSLIKVS